MATKPTETAAVPSWGPVELMDSEAGQLFVGFSQYICQIILHCFLLHTAELNLIWGQGDLWM